MGIDFLSRGFIESPVFTEKWRREGLSEDDLLILQLALLQNPKAGDVMKGTGRLRKIRFATGSRGKSAGIRVLYIDFELHGRIYLVDFFSKNEKENLSAEERAIIRKRIPEIEQELFGGQNDE